nr:helix-turn-helix transcriptional regulator [Clostridia bacterium]
MANLNFNVIGQNIRRIRMEKGWTQKDLSISAALSVSQVSRLERGMASMTVTTFFKLCNALTCKPADLLKDAE